MPASRTHSLPVLFAAALTLSAVPAGAQTYFAPLVTPPASIGTCLPTRQVPVQDDTTHVVQRRFVMKSAPPGRSRMLVLVTGRGRSIVYSDMTVNGAVPTRPSGIDVVASTDTLGNMHGWVSHSTTTFPDSIARKHPSAATLARLGSLAHTTSSRTALSAADQARVRQMTAWMLKRCS